MNFTRPRARAVFTFLLVTLGLSYACVEASYTWRGRFDLELLGLLVCGGGLGIWLLARAAAGKARLPRTGGLGWGLALGLLSTALSLAASADPRQSLWRVAELAGLGLLFYAFLDGFSAGWLERKAALAGLLLVSGVVMVLALLETYAWYLRWFGAVGGGEWPPFQYRFGSIFGYSNALMSLANLAAPLALVVFLKARGLAGRAAAAGWLLFYLAAVPFSSSRGGWMGLLGWGGALGLGWLVSARPWRVVLGWRRRGQALLGAGLLGGLAAAGFLGLRFWLAFAAHPSHGSDPFGGRSGLWAYAIALWRRSPLVGVGPGRYALEHPLVNPNVPPEFWSYNAHGMFVEVLTEFGALGLLALALLLIVGARLGWQRWRTAAPEQQPFALALLAGLAGWACQMIVDDFTSWIAIMAPLVLMAAWLFSLPAPEGRADRGRLFKRRLPLNLLWLPALALFGYLGWDLWTYAPAWRGLRAAESGNWPAAYAAYAEAARRDPALAFYNTEAGLAAAWAWGQSGDPALLAEARRRLALSAAREPQLSPLRANLAALDGQAGAQEEALEGLRQAARQSPKEPSYPLNLGFLLETQGREEEALAAYRQALELEPDWGAHPFWATTPLRARARAGWSSPVPAAAPDLALSAFEEALRAGDWAAAQRSLARAGIENDVTVFQARLSEARGEPDAALAAYRAARELLGQPVLRRASNFSFAYTRWGYNRPGLLVDRVPGYLNLDGGAAVFAGMERLYTLEAERGECEQARRTWEVWQTAGRGFAPGPQPSAPVCR